MRRLQMGRKMGHICRSIQALSTLQSIRMPAQGACNVAVGDLVMLALQFWTVAGCMRCLMPSGEPRTTIYSAVGCNRLAVGPTQLRALLRSRVAVAPEILFPCAPVDCNETRLSCPFLMQFHQWLGDCSAVLELCFGSWAWHCIPLLLSDEYG